VALDSLGLEMVAPYIKGANVLCLGYPDITARPERVEALLGVKPRKFTEYGRAHKISWPLPETVDTLLLAGAKTVVCVDRVAERGVEVISDLNLRWDWVASYDVVINPGTLEHCFNIARATFNAWNALETKGVMLSAAPLSMGNHGFYNIQPTFFADFARANGGEVLRMEARDRDWKPVSVSAKGRFSAPPESVLYSLVRKNASVPESIPTQGRFG
jgi:hypothetical protein